MSLDIDKNGNIFIYKGDSGEIVLKGLPVDKNYRVYFMVKDEKDRIVGSTLEVQSNFSPTVRFLISSEYSSIFKIPKEEDFGVYYYGIKLVDDNESENTLFVKGSTYGQKNKIIVFPEKVEV